MYVRIKTTPNSPKKSVQIVASERVGNKVSQRIVRHVGTALDEDELKRLKELAEYIKSKLESDTQPMIFSPETMAEMAIEGRKKLTQDKELPVDLKKLREEQRVIVGIHEVYQKVYDEIGFHRCLGQPQRVVESHRKLFHTVMARIANPRSKRESVNMLEKDFGVHLSLQGIYEMMDKINEEKIEYIKDLSYQAAKKIFPEPINVVFYDCTTLYFESFIEDELKKNGYSKDMKFNQPQVLLALMVTTHGLPIGYELFPGSTFEGDTLEQAITIIENKFEIKNVIFVADSALLSDDNLKLLEKLGKTYIVGARIKNTSNVLKEQILDKSNYHSFTHTFSKEDNTETHATFDYGENRTLYVTYNQSRAEKDRYDREKNITKIKNKLSKSKNPKSLISNYGYKKYIELEGESKIIINEQKMIEDAKWDGLHGIVTNSTTFTASDVVSYYHGLWQIEECFRISKHDLKVRPIFHWTPKRVKAHIAICFIALVCVRHLEYRIATQYKKLSPEVIRNELIHIQVSILKHIDTSDRYVIPSKVSLNQRKIYQIMGMKLSDIPFKI